MLSGHLAHLPLSCQVMLQDAVSSGMLGPADMDPKIVIDLCGMPERSALVCVERFLGSNLFSIRNKSGFMVGVINRFKTDNPNYAACDGSDLASAGIPSKGDPARTIHVGNLTESIGEAVLRQIFGCIGELVELRAAQGSGNYKKEKKAKYTRFLVCSPASQGRSGCGVAALWCTTHAGFGPFSPTYRVPLGTSRAKSGRVYSAQTSMTVTWLVAGSAGLNAAGIMPKVHDMWVNCRFGRQAGPLSCHRFLPVCSVVGDTSLRFGDVGVPCASTDL